MSWGPNNIIATAGGDNTIRLFQFNEGQKLEHRHTQDEAHDSDVNCVQFAPSSGLLASCGDDCQLKLWKIE